MQPKIRKYKVEERVAERFIKGMPTPNHSDFQDRAPFQVDENIVAITIDNLGYQNSYYIEGASVLLNTIKTLTEPPIYSAEIFVVGSDRNINRAKSKLEEMTKVKLGKAKKSTK